MCDGVLFVCLYPVPAFRMLGQEQTPEKSFFNEKPEESISTVNATIIRPAQAFSGAEIINLLALNAQNDIQHSECCMICLCVRKDLCMLLHILMGEAAQDSLTLWLQRNHYMKKYYLLLIATAASFTFTSCKTTAQVVGSLTYLPLEKTVKKDGVVIRCTAPRLMGPDLGVGYVEYSQEITVRTTDGKEYTRKHHFNSNQPGAKAYTGCVGRAEVGVNSDYMWKFEPLY